MLLNQSFHRAHQSVSSIEYFYKSHMHVKNKIKGYPMGIDKKLSLSVAAAAAIEELNKKKGNKQNVKYKNRKKGKSRKG